MRRCSHALELCFANQTLDDLGGPRFELDELEAHTTRPVLVTGTRSPLPDDTTDALDRHGLSVDHALELQQGPGLAGRARRDEHTADRDVETLTFDVLETRRASIARQKRNGSASRFAALHKSPKRRWQKREKRQLPYPASAEPCLLRSVYQNRSGRVR